MSNLSLTIVSHACIKVTDGSATLLCDPWFVNEPVYNFTTWKYPDVRLTPDEVVKDVTHLFISHGHEDHFHIPSINYLSRDIEVVLPEYVGHPGLRAQTIERTMRALGFSNITKILPWESLNLSKNLNVTAIPCAASKPQDWENSGLVIENGTTRILNMNDNPSDDPLYEDLVSRFDHFDLVLIQYAGVSSFPGRFKFSDKERREIVKTRRTNFDEQRRAVEYLNFDYLVPFAGDFAWFDDELIHCNWASRATPVLFRDWFEENYPDHDGELLFLYPSDQWSPSLGAERNHPSIDWTTYLDDIKKLKAEKQYKVDAINNWLAKSDASSLQQRTKIFLSNMERWAGARRYIDFDACFRFLIGSTQDAFSFVLGANPESGLIVSWDESLPTDQTVFLSAHVWASILEGKILCSTLHWIGLIDQTVPFRPDLPKFWWWIEFYADLNNRSPQVLVETLQYHGVEPVQPQKGVFV